MGGSQIAECNGQHYSAVNALACGGRFFSRIPQALLLIYCSFKSKKRPFGRAQVIYGTEIIRLPLLSSEPDGVGQRFLA